MSLLLIAVSCILLPACSEKVAPMEAAAASEARLHDTKLDNIYTLFVGIDRYRFSDISDFSDLKGAVRDVGNIKQALSDIYGLEMDRRENGKCRSANRMSRTLVNECATRSEILAALDQMIAALKPGDTLLFYYAGHGGRYRDDRAFDQDSGYNGTIMPHDARNPDGAPGDIYDFELKQRKDRATAKGIYFVSLFDSCNSATATRDGATGLSRSVTALAPAPPEGLPEINMVGSGNGYWVHLAAAQDGQIARERGDGVQRVGVFTDALIGALKMPGMSGATFGDIIREVQIRVSESGNSSQNPSGEGKLTAALGKENRSPVLFRAAAESEGMKLAAGSLSGITLGSRFAFYADQKDAVERANMLASGAVTRVEPAAAWITIETTGADMPQDLVAEETAHFFPPDILKVRNDIRAVPARNAADRALQEIGFAKTAGAGPVRLHADDGKNIHLRADDGMVLAELGDAESPVFLEKLEAELKKVARVQQLLALRTTGQSVFADSGLGPVDFCVAKEGYRASACPPLENGLRHIDQDDRTFATIRNRGSQPAYIYLLAIDPLNGVILVLPKPGETDQMIKPFQPYRRGPMSFAVPGTYRFITIASDQPIRLDAFQQSGNGVRNLGSCTTPLERLLCSASQGKRTSAVTSVGSWSASVSSAIVQ